VTAASHECGTTKLKCSTRRTVSVTQRAVSRDRYDFGTGYAINSLANSIFGDALLGQFLLRLIGFGVARLTVKNEPSERLAEQTLRSADPDYLPWRIVHLSKVWVIALLSFPIIPLVLPITIGYHLLAFIVDRINILRLVEPIPPTTGLCMRFIVCALLPVAVIAGQAVGLIGFYNLEQSFVAEGESVWRRGPILFHCVFYAIFTATFAFEILVVQRAIALEHSLMTPAQLLLSATFGSDEAFAITTSAEPFSASVEADLGSHIKDDDFKRLYAPRPTDVLLQSQDFRLQDIDSEA